MEKKIKQILFIGFLAVAFSLVANPEVRAQTLSEEKEEQLLERAQRELTPAEIAEREKAYTPRRPYHIKFSYGYDTNPQLATTRKRDDYESFRFGGDFRKTLAERHQLSLSFNVNEQSYNDITELTNQFGNLRMDYKFAFSKKYVTGFGYDGSVAYYPKNPGSEYINHKAFVNFQHRVTSNFHHKLQYEHGWKLYDEALALFRSPATFTDNRRKDVRDGVVYSIGYTMTDRLSSNLSLSYKWNVSNSEFQNYYDYESFSIAPRFYYKFNDSLSANLSYSYKRKRFQDRLVPGTTYERTDRISKADVGLNYRLSDINSFNLNYTYNENSSNDSSSTYTGSALEAGWRYNF